MTDPRRSDRPPRFHWRHLMNYFPRKFELGHEILAQNSESPTPSRLRGFSSYRRRRLLLGMGRVTAGGHSERPRLEFHSGVRRHGICRFATNRHLYLQFDANFMKTSFLTLSPAVLVVAALAFRLGLRRTDNQPPNAGG
jgi:hypothetical protein